MNIKSPGRVFISLSFLFVVLLTGCTKSELSLKADCTNYIPVEMERFQDEGDMSYSHLLGVFYSTELNTCVSKWSLWAGDVGTLKFGYFDVENGKNLKEIIEYADSSDGSMQFPSWTATVEKAKDYESSIGLLLNTVEGSISSESGLAQSICKLDSDQVKAARVDEMENQYYYDTYQDIFYSAKLNTCLSKWQRYWVNDQHLQILYYDALSGQIINDPNLPFFSISEFSSIDDEQLQELLELESIQ